MKYKTHTQKFNLIKENDIINFANIKIEVVKAIHGYNPNLKNGEEVFENVGCISSSIAR